MDCLAYQRGNAQKPCNVLEGKEHNTDADLSLKGNLSHKSYHAMLPNRAAAASPQEAYTKAAKEGVALFLI
jgi:hypothetical protein